MEVTTTIEPEDVWQFARSHSLPRLLRRQIVTILIITVVVEVYFFYIRAAAEWTISVPFLYFALFALGLLLLKPRVMKQARSSPGLLGLTTTAISPTGVRRRNPIGESSNPWGSYTDVRADTHNIYFFLSKTQAQILPRRAFATPDEAERFLSTAQAYWNAARNGTPLPADIPDDGVWPPAPRTL